MGLRHALNEFIRISPIHRNAPMTFPHILVFDSGLGGLTVLESLYTALPEGQYTYLADNAAFPYGALTEEILTARIVEVSDKLLPKIKPDILVIACSTASTLVLPRLRAQLSIPVVGVVPGIKPAASLSKTKLITLLATPATVDRPDTQSLIHTYAQDCLVNRVGSPVLALYSEAEFSHMPATDAQLLEAILPCFIHNTLGKTDVIVLGCTHYPLILHRLEALAPWPVTWVNPAPAIAKRVISLLSQQGYTQTTGISSLTPAGAQGKKRAIFTATPFSILHNSTFLSRFSFTQVGTEDIPFLSKTS